MSDKVREANQYSYFKAKYPGIGNEDTTREEFLATYYKDSLSSIVQHKHILNYNSLATNKNPKLYKTELLKKMSDHT